MEKWPGMAPNGAGKVFFRLIQTLPTFWGDMDFDFEIFYLLDLLDSKFLDFQVLRFPKSGPGRAWARQGRAWPRLEPSGQTNVDFLS